MRLILKPIIYNLNSTQKGFTSVELLITLFVAAIFLTAGYQLSSVIVKDGGDIRAQSRASNLAYDYLQRQKALISVGDCTASSGTFTPTDEEKSGLSNLSANYEVTCPYESATPPIKSLSKITITLKYGTPGKTIIESTYVTK